MNDRSARHTASNGVLDIAVQTAADAVDRVLATGSITDLHAMHDAVQTAQDLGATLPQIAAARRKGGVTP
ncbi:hypothetical protein ABZ752_22835 [Streptomyces roseifaciens]